MPGRRYSRRQRKQGATMGRVLAVGISRQGITAWPKMLNMPVNIGRNRRNWTGGDSNPYGLLHQILSLARLPISPPVRRGWGE